jgi:dTDP-glucose pyrophosphorylase
MKVVFLCGGIGKRMSPITEDKLLLHFLGKTLLEHQMEIAKEAGLNQFLVIGNPANMEQIEQITRVSPGVKTELALQQQPLGIADALKSAEPFLDGDIVVVLHICWATKSRITSLEAIWP